MSLKAGNYYGVLEQCEVVQVGERKVEAFEMRWNVNYIWDGSEWVHGDDLPTQRHIRFFLTDAAWPHTEDKLRALGFNGDFTAPRLDAELYEKGRALNCSINAKGYEDWEIAGLIGVQAEPASADRLRQFNAKWKAKNRPAAPAAQAAPQTAQATHQPTPEPQAQAAPTPQTAPAPPGEYAEDDEDDDIPW